MDDTPPDTATASASAPADLRRTPLHALHLEAGARLVPFAGYAMPVQYPAGILAEHRHTRSQAGLFDVSHMGQLRLIGSDAAAALERLVPGDMLGLKPGRMRYSLFTSESGGILDDLMAIRRADGLFLVVNAARKVHDLAYLRASLPGRVAVEALEEHALLALQGPAAAAVMARFVPETGDLTFLSACDADLAGTPCLISRSGYTGEDGFEVSLPADRAEGVARLLLAEPEVELAGLGARDSLRLEAGLCLYGHDIDETTTPIEADLAWTIGKRRKMNRDFPGAGPIMAQLFEGAPRKRVGIRPEGRAPARENTSVLDEEGRRIGRVTSGTFGPSVNGPIAMGYVATGHAADGTALGFLVRNRPIAARVAPLPFVPHRYVRGGQ